MALSLTPLASVSNYSALSKVWLKPIEFGRRLAPLSWPQDDLVTRAGEQRHRKYAVCVRARMYVYSMRMARPVERHARRRGLVTSLRPFLRPPSGARGSPRDSPRQGAALGQEPGGRGQRPSASGGRAWGQGVAGRTQCHVVRRWPHDDRRTRRHGSVREKKWPHGLRCMKSSCTMCA